MKKYIAIDGINNDQSDFDTIEEAREWIMEIIVCGEEIHPDAESCYIVSPIEEVSVEKDWNSFYKINFKSYE